MLGTIWNTVIFNPIMNAVLILYSLFGDNLGWAIIIFTIVLKILLFPFTKSQLESSKKIKTIQPQLEKLQKKYKKTPQKLQEEQLKLYRKVGYNPLGCFTSILIPLPILIAIYQAVRLFTNGGDLVIGEIPGIYQFVRNILDVKKSIEPNFFGMDLSQTYLLKDSKTGEFSFNSPSYLVLVILTGISQFISVRISAKQQEGYSKKKKSKGAEEDMVASMSKSMSFTFPMMTTVIALSMPAGVTLYWVVQSLITVITNIVYNNLKSKKK